MPVAHNRWRGEDRPVGVVTAIRQMVIECRIGNSFLSYRPETIGLFLHQVDVEIEVGEWYYRWYEGSKGGPLFVQIRTAIGDQITTVDYNGGVTVWTKAEFCRKLRKTIPVALNEALGKHLKNSLNGWKVIDIDVNNGVICYNKYLDEGWRMTKKEFYEIGADPKPTPVEPRKSDVHSALGIAPHEDAVKEIQRLKKLEADFKKVKALLTD